MVYVAFTWVLGPSSGPHATEVRFLTELFPQVRQLIYKKEKEKKRLHLFIYVGGVYQVYMWGSEDSFLELTISFYYGDLRD